MALLLITANTCAADLVELNSKNYKEFGDVKGVVILKINWGRRWACAGNENAQLQELEFSKLDESLPSANWETIKLKTKPTLFVDNEFREFAYIVEPGEYALTGFDVKIAKTERNISHFVGDRSKLMKEGKPQGGSFSVSANEIVYIGHFGLDCSIKPIPWRYYIDGAEEFTGYTNVIRQRYPFIKNKEIAFRLFSTTSFGSLYELE